MKKITTEYYKLLILLALVAGMGCSPRKNTALNRFWHRTNTHYNGWFNGNEAIKTGIQDLQKSRKDDFTKIIPVYEYGDPSNFTNMSANADRAIKKGVIMIKKHSMLINGKQYNKWIDDCYLMMGKAQYFKSEYNVAVGQLRYVAENSEKQVSKDEARIWMVRAYNELGEWADAGTTIRQIDKEGLNAKLKGPYYAAIADYFIRQKEWEKGIEALNLAIKNTRKKKIQARYYFIIGQLYQELNSNPDAYASFKKVLENKPEYELEFQSKINMAKTSDNHSNESLRKLLARMLKDGKNIEYQDQIYYAIAIVDLKEEKQADAIRNLKKSVAVSVSNNNQKSLSFLKLAEIYFQGREYEPAQAYYDSTSVLMDKKHPRYEEVMRLKENLTLVVQNIRIVALQDSLQKLGRMSEDDLVAYLEDYVEDLKTKDEEAKNNQGNVPVNFNNNTLNNQGKWYFYNQQTLAFGLNDFRKIWGTRPLEDDWRRKNKSSNSFTNSGEEDTTENKINPRYDVSTYLSEIPRTDSAFAASNAMIYQALYDLGLVYKDKIYDYPRSAEAFENLVSRNTENNHFPITYYQLYLVYTQMKNQQKADEYKNILLTQYPESEYAKLISDPGYLASLDEANDLAGPLYTQAYNLYKTGLYTDAMSTCSAAMQQYPDSKLGHRFALLSALCVGKLQPEMMFVAALEAVKKDYSGTESAVTADKLLKYLKGENNNTTSGPNVNNSVASFKFEPNAEHFFILVFEDPAMKLDQISAKLANYNDQHFQLKGLSISNTLMGKNYQVLVVKKFQSSKDVMAYSQSLKRDGFIDQFKLSVKNYQFPITIANYSVLFKQQNMTEYAEFYEKYYNAAQ